MQERVPIPISNNSLEKKTNLFDSLKKESPKIELNNNLSNFNSLQKLSPQMKWPNSSVVTPRKLKK